MQNTIVPNSAIKQLEPEQVLVQLEQLQLEVLERFLLLELVLLELVLSLLEQLRHIPLRHSQCCCHNQCCCHKTCSLMLERCKCCMSHS